MNEQLMVNGKQSVHIKNDVEWIAQYLGFNQSITVWQAQVLRGMAESTLSARISEMRRMGWDIECINGVYTLISEPKAADEDGCICIEIDVLKEISETLRFVAGMIDNRLAGAK